MARQPLKYIHGYQSREQKRLLNQAEILATFVFKELDWACKQQILELGSGVGGQTLQLLKRFPQAHITCVEISSNQIDAARINLKKFIKEGRVTLLQGAAESLPFEEKSFDGVFVCWLLEHVDRPHTILSEARRVLKPGGEIQIREVLNKLWHAEPQIPLIEDYWFRFNSRQLRLGGDPYVGSKLGRLLFDSGFKNVQIEIRSHLFDKRDLAFKKKMIDYWRDLFLSGIAQVEARKLPIKKKLLKKHFDLLKRNSQSCLYFGFAHGQASK